MCLCLVFVAFFLLLLLHLVFKHTLADISVSEQSFSKLLNYFFFIMGVLKNTALA